MRVLGLDTATASTAVALVDGQGRVFRDRMDDRRHSVNLLPAMERLLQKAGCAREDLNAVAVGIGPGSFTGVRIGLSVAKTLAYALDVPLLGVSSLKALALGAVGHAEVAERLADGAWQLCCASDALKAEVYGARYRLASDGRLWQVEAEAARDPADWARSLLEQDQDENLIFVGSGAQRYAHAVLQILGDRAFVPRDPEIHVLDPAAVASLGLERALAGEADDPMSLEPLYCRLSEAELGRLKAPAL